MGSDLEPRLRDLIEEAEHKAEQVLKDGLESVADRIRDELVDSALDEVQIRVPPDLVEEVKVVRQAASTLDAVEVLHQRVIGRNLARPSFEDIDLRGVDEFYELREILDDHREWIHRGFVYVAWRQRRDERGRGPFFYIGRADNDNRLDLNRHVKLSHAVMPSTYLTLIFPTQSNEETLAAVEASLLRTLDFTGQQPFFNEKPEPVPASVGSRHLTGLGGFLVQLGNLMGSLR